MLDKLILTDGIMSMDAEGLLKVLGKPALPLLDILVRESIQNSLDAALKKKSVEVDFSWKFYQKDTDLANKLKKVLGEKSDITKRLYQRLKKGQQGIILIRDIGTTGLSGFSEKTKGYEDYKERQNFFNLIFNIGRNHGGKGSGGSYGFGKTIYFKIAASGLVFYYSRCLNEKGKPEHRLIFSMVSLDEMNAAKNSGIAWWGGDTYIYQNTKNIKPLKGTEALRVLKHFGIEPFQDSETGTLIGIIGPTIGSLMPHENSDNNPETFAQRFANSVGQSVLKWYWPRMMDNPRKLKVSVNEKMLNPAVSHYGLYADLLKASLRGNEFDYTNLNEEKYVYYNNKIFPVEEMPDKPVTIYPVLSKRPASFIGTLSVMEIPGVHNLPDLDFLNKIAMIRKPGMVVYYEGLGIANRTDKKVIGLFLVNSDFSVGRSQKERNGYYMDDAFRKCEDPSHNTWNHESLDATDDSWFKSFVRVAKKQISDKMNRHLMKTDPVRSDGSSMSLAAKLLGRVLFADGRQTSQISRLSFGGSRGPGGTGGAKKQKPQVRILETNYSENGNVEVDFEMLNIREGEHSIKLYAIADNGTGYDRNKWNEDGLRQFPFAFKKMDILACTIDGKPLQKNNAAQYSELHMSLAADNKTAITFTGPAAGTLSVKCRTEILIIERDVMFDIDF